MKLLHNSNKKQGKVELKNVIYIYFYLCLDHKKLVPKTDKETYSIKRRIQGLAHRGGGEGGSRIIEVFSKNILFHAVPCREYKHKIL